MKTLLIMRHAKSSWSNSRVSDHERPLNDRGKQDAPQMGRLLKAHDLTPDLIISSDAKRAATTAELVAIACDYEATIIYNRDFYLAPPETYLETLQTIDAAVDCVMVVGHNPGMEMLVSELTDVDEPFTTANIAHVRLAINSWQEITDGVDAKLADLWRPKEI